MPVVEMKRLSFSGYNLDLSISKGLRQDSIEEVLQACRQFVAKFSQSWKQVDVLPSKNQCCVS